ncbi:hypothetical protein DERP_004224 [Dermatophagoides pteronyssinus]|uniref:ZP domain-containing protein n=1 Tax=Dermatophagoides pteronyssinus TaxID=6956 RepID=A0ABQ8J8K0_DERPT|nr:hypothetical protein DERP_004224 [Dermatophagoides pteronyssinus]
MDSMIIQVNLSSLYTDGQMSNDDDDEPYVYLEKLRSFSICRPKMEKFMATFVLSLQDDFYRCGTTKIHDQITGTRIYYNRIVVETKQHRNSINGQQQQQRSIYFKCSQPNIDRLLGFKVETSPLDDDDDVDLIHNKTERIKRETTSSWIEDSSGRLVNFTEIDLPENFMEAEVLDFTDNITARAPYPHLNLKVKRNGKFVNQSLNVAPGTPLEMIIYLDDESKHVYGLLASFMKVTDNTNRQQEVIVLNGCSIDPYIFGNFESNDGGDSISAKFRAFKFPESNYVMFIGTVNVCLDKCQETPCGNGIYALGRRRRRRKRSLPMEMPKDPNKVFEIEMMAYLRIGYSDEELAKHRIRQSTIQATGIVDQTKSMITESGKNPPIVAHLIDNKQNENNDDAQYESLTSSFSLSSASSSLIMIKSISNYSSHLFSIIFLLTFSRYIIFHY